MGLQRLINLRNRFEGLEAEMVVIVERNIDARSILMAELNREQLNQGLRSDGTLLPPYAPNTIKKKILEGKQSDPMNLRDTGSWQDHIIARKFGNKLVEMQSEDSKDALIAEQFGEAVLGLTDESFEVIRELFAPDAYRDVIKYLNIR